MSYTKTTWVNNTTPINETNLNKIESGIKNNDINIGEENYDNTKTYEVGDIVRYNEKIYKCITAITTAENFDISKWEQTNIVEIVQSEKSKIYELIEAISTPIVGEGENITLNDTAEKRFENFDIEGNSEQEATPSPDYPSEVKSCGDDVNELNPIAGGSQGINSSVIEGKISFSGTANTTFANITSITVGVIKKGTYIFSINEAKNYSVRLRMYYTESEYIDAIIPENKKEVVIELTNDVIKYYTYIYPLTAGTNYNDFIYEKLQKGTTVTPYSPYGQGCINEVICNKNLISIDDITLTDAGVTITKNGDTFVINGTVSGGKLLVFNPSKILKVLGDYTLSVKYVSGLKSGLSYFNLRDYETNSLLLNANLITSDTSATITIESITQIKYGIYLVSGTTFTNYTFKVQLEKGTTATDYEEHKSQTYTIPTQQPMRAIGNVRDKFILKENGKWYERHYIARKIFDGTENFNLGTNANSLIYFFTNAGSIKAKSQDLLCNKLTTVTTLWNETENKDLIAIRSELDLFNIMLSDTTINTVDLFKSYLQEQYNAGTPVYVDYILKTPLDIECTSEQTEILNQIYIKAKSYKGVTHIYGNDEVSPNCYVEAVKDLTTLIQ